MLIRLNDREIPDGAFRNGVISCPRIFKANKNHSYMQVILLIFNKIFFNDLCMKQSVAANATKSPESGVCVPEPCFVVVLPYDGGRSHRSAAPLRHVSPIRLRLFRDFAWLHLLALRADLLMKRVFTDHIFGDLEYALARAAPGQYVRNPYPTDLRTFGNSAFVASFEPFIYLF